MASRWRFLEAIAEHAPQVLHELRDDILRLHECRLFDPSGSKAYLAAIRCWAIKWHLAKERESTPEWLASVVRRTLDEWLRQPELQRAVSIRFRDPRYSTPALGSEDFVIRLNFEKYLAPSSVSRGDIRVVRKALAKEVLALLDADLERWQGQWDAERKHTQKGLGFAEVHKREDVHYKWAVEFQVLGYSAEAIALKHNTSPQTVMSGVTSVLRRVEILKRQVRKGRPQKAKKHLSKPG